MHYTQTKRAGNFESAAWGTIEHASTVSAPRKARRSKDAPQQKERRSKDAPRQKVYMSVTKQVKT